MTKIEALQKTIYNLENDVYEYNWISSNSCNCGILARTLMNGALPLDEGFHNSPMRGKGGAFSRETHCLKSDLPLPKVFRYLKNAGFTSDDMTELEYLGNKKILNRIGEKWYECGSARVIDGNKYDDKDTVIKYLKSWVSILQEEETTTQPVQTPPAEQPKVIEKTVYVSVPTSITEQSKELILS